MGERDAHIRGLVKAYAQALQARIRLERIILFGSCARGQAGPNSDIDLLVVSPDFGGDIIAKFRTLRGCLPRHTIAIDTLGCTPGELAAAEPGDILATAAQGLVLFDPAQS